METAGEVASGYAAAVSAISRANGVMRVLVCAVSRNHSPRRSMFWCIRKSSPRIWMIEGSWPYLVKRGRLEVSQRFPVYRRVGKAALLLRESPSTHLVEVPVLSTSPKLAKSPLTYTRAKRPLPSVQAIRSSGWRRPGGLPMKHLTVFLSIHCPAWTCPSAHPRFLERPQLLARI
jgi:hypothetical protein